eukprot:684527-Amphidinium_carterae.1
MNGASLPRSASFDTPPHVTWRVRFSCAETVDCYSYFRGVDGTVSLKPASPHAKATRTKRSGTVLELIRFETWSIYYILVD